MILQFDFTIKTKQRTQKKFKTTLILYCWSFNSNALTSTFELFLKDRIMKTCLNIILKGTWGHSNNFSWKWSFFSIKQNGINKKFQKCLFKPQLASCMFSHVYDVTYIEIQFNQSKLRNFISSWEMVRKIIN